MSLIKRNVINDDLAAYSIAVIGSPGVGKTTLMVESCKKEFGEDGYVVYNMGSEQGIDCIEDAAYIDVPNWKSFAATNKELIEKRDTEYKDIKVLVWDTIDQLFEFTEPQVIINYNRENAGEPKFKKCTSINSAYGGFGRGMDKAIEMVIGEIVSLQNAGYRIWYCAHVKNREILDAVSGETYTQLTASMPQKYFNAIKDRMHCVAVACVDRKIETEGTGRKNIATKQEITVNKVKDERRKIVFRDNDFVIDAKSRFQNIVDEVPLDSDEFLQALKDAIKNSKSGKSKTTKKSTPTPTPKPEPTPDPEVDDDDDLFEEDIDEVVEEESSDYPDDMQDQIRAKFKAAEKDVKAKVKELLAENGVKLADADIELQKQLFDILK